MVFSMRRQKIAFVVLFCLAGLTLTGCPQHNAVLEPTDPKYREAVSSFFAGTLALQVSDQNRPEAFLKKATELMPGEPAAWPTLPST